MRTPRLQFLIIFFVSLLLFATDARAQSIDTVSRDTGTVAVPITITGDGFGTKKPKVTFQNANKKLSFTVTSFSDTEIVGTLKTGAAGIFNVTVTPKGAAPIVAQNAFTVAAPSITTISPGSALVNDVVFISGSAFGGKKGTVKIGKGTGKVVAWTNTQIIVSVPKLANGNYVVTIKNAVGTDTTNLTIGTPNLGGLAGVAAVGDPITNATVTVKDKNGVTAVGQTNSNGEFDINVAGLALPFLLKVDIPGGGTLFGIAEQSGIANISPITDLVIECWYYSLGTTAAAAFADPLASPPPTPVQLQAIINIIKPLLELWLLNLGLDPATFDLITSPFVANGAGFDLLLSYIAVVKGAGEIDFTIQDDPNTPLTTQTTSIDFDSLLGLVETNSVINGPSGSSQSSTETLLPTTQALLDAVAGTNATFIQFQTSVLLQGSQLADTHLLPLLTSDFHHDGEGAAVFAGFNADDFRGLTIQSAVLERIVSFDSINNIITTDTLLTFNDGVQSASDTLTMTFKKVGDKWLMFGNQQLGEVSVEMKLSINLPGFQPHFDTPTPQVNIDIRVPENTVQSVKISGGGLFNDTNVPLNPQVTIEEYEFAPGQFDEVRQDAYFLSQYLQNPLPAGTQFTITITPVAGAPAAYVVETGGSTNEPFSIVTPVGYTLADAMLGQPLNIQWTLPTSFVIRRIDVGGHTSTANAQCDSETLQQFFAPTATNATITFEPTCDGNAVTSASFHISIDGTFGQRVQIIYLFQN